MTLGLFGYRIRVARATRFPVPRARVPWARWLRVGGAVGMALVSVLPAASALAAGPAGNTLTLNVVSSSEIDLSWQDNQFGNADFDLVLRCAGTGCTIDTSNYGPFVISANLSNTATFYPDTTVAASTTYGYVVVGINPTGIAQDSTGAVIYATTFAAGGASGASGASGSSGASGASGASGSSGSTGACASGAPGSTGASGASSQGGVAACIPFEVAFNSITLSTGAVAFADCKDSSQNGAAGLRAPNGTCNTSALPITVTVVNSGNVNVSVKVKGSQAIPSNANGPNWDLCSSLATCKDSGGNPGSASPGLDQYNVQVHAPGVFSPFIELKEDVTTPNFVSGFQCDKFVDPTPNCVGLAPGVTGSAIEVADIVGPLSSTNTSPSFTMTWTWFVG